MRRRELIALAATAAVIWARRVPAQQRKIPVIGYVGGTIQSTTDERLASFHDGLAEMGFTDGKNVAIEFRWTEGHVDRLPKLMVDLVRQQVAAIFTAGGDVATLIAKGATRSIPIVFLTASDPVRSGLVVC